MKQVFLGLAIHNHQPVGNFDFVFRDAYARAYLPMIELLERHAAVHVTLHYTGPLYDWLAANQPQFLKRIRALVARGQIEVMTGGYYEPILASIPDADKRGQIEKMTRLVKKEFGYSARGLWLAERVWEPQLAKPIAEAGVDYTLVDDTHFKAVGLEDKDLFGYYVTEEQGTTLKIFGTSKYLRYSIPWALAEETIAWLREQATEDGARIAVMGDDGEKFGLWPGTFPHCWGADSQTGWMEEFFRALEENKEWLHTITLAEYAERFQALGRIYLPTASYDEMSEWALPAYLSGNLTRLKHQLQDEKRVDVLRFIRGGFWRHFLVKYPEANAMHKKMLLVSEQLKKLQTRTADAKKPGGRGAKEQRRVPLISHPLDHLYAGQCNCPYWHGVFGGIYLPHIRHANYTHLIAAENVADEFTHGKQAWIDYELADYDRDSHAELLVSGSAMNLYFDLARGGAIVEWDWRAKKMNLVNTLARREEGYHRDLVEAAERGAIELPGGTERKVETIHSSVVRAKEPGLEKSLTFDWYRRVGLIDHWLPLAASLDEFARAQYPELGDFIDQTYKAQVKRQRRKTKSTERELTVSLSRGGHVWQGDVHVPIHVEKQLTLRAGAHNLPIAYFVSNSSNQPVTARLGIEFCFGLLAGHVPEVYYRATGIAGEDAYLDSRGEITADEIALVNEMLGIEIALELDAPTRIWRTPIETVSLSEAGFERVYQGSCLVLLWDVRLAPGDKWERRFEFNLR